jgi:hypothetical protein
MSNMMEDPSMRDAHHGCMDPQIQEETQDVQVVDPTLTDQHEEIESHLLETPLVEKIVETDKVIEQLLPGSVCIDEDALFSSQDDHSMCLDTYAWDPGTDHSSRVSAHEDIAAHTGYDVMWREIEPTNGVQWKTGGPSNTVDSGKFNTLSYAESVFGYSRVDTSRSDNNSEGYEVAPQHDHDQEPHHLETQLIFSEAMIMVATRRSDDMHALMADFCWRASVAHGSSDEGITMDDFHTQGESIYDEDRLPVVVD